MTKLIQVWDGTKWVPVSAAAPIGATGPTGSTGPTGPTGSTGPAGVDASLADILMLGGM